MLCLLKKGVIGEMCTAIGSLRTPEPQRTDAAVVSSAGGLCSKLLTWQWSCFRWRFCRSTVIRLIRGLDWRVGRHIVRRRRLWGCVSRHRIAVRGWPRTSVRRGRCCCATRCVDHRGVIGHTWCIGILQQPARTRLCTTSSRLCMRASCSRRHMQQRARGQENAHTVACAGPGTK